VKHDGFYLVQNHELVLRVRMLKYGTNLEQVLTVEWSQQSEFSRFCKYFVTLYGGRLWTMRTTTSQPQQTTTALRNVIVLYPSAEMQTLGEQCRFWSGTALDDALFSLCTRDVCLIHAPLRVHGPLSARTFTSLCEQYSSRVMIVAGQHLSHVLPDSLDLLIIMTTEDNEAKCASRYGASPYPVWVVKDIASAEDRCGAMEWLLKALQRVDIPAAELRNHGWMFGGSTRSASPAAAAASCSAVTLSAAAAVALATSPAVLSSAPSSPYMEVGKSQFLFN